MARFLVIGASHGIGLETVKAALAAGHAVRAFARTASAMPLDHGRLEKVDGDARDPASVGAALSGVDVVVQSLGVAINPQTVLGGTRLFSVTTRVLVDAMERHGPRRLIAVTGLGAGDSRGALRPLHRLAYELSIRRVYDDKDVQEMIIRRSGLDWTIVRPGFLTNAAKGTWRALVDRGRYEAGSIARGDIATFIIAHFDDPAYLHKAPVLVW